MSDEKPFEQKPLKEVLAAAGKRAIGGGIPGAMAMSVQVTTLIGLRATMNYRMLTEKKGNRYQSFSHKKKTNQATIFQNIVMAQQQQRLLKRCIHKAEYVCALFLSLHKTC
jgi:hypothetical protein